MNLTAGDLKCGDLCYLNEDSQLGYDSSIRMKTDAFEFVAEEGRDPSDCYLLSLRTGKHLRVSKETKINYYEGFVEINNPVGPYRSINNKIWTG